MNERIKELAEQAREKKFDYRAREGESHYIYVLNEEKFAELIVEECAGIVENKIEVSRYVHEAELLRECSATIKLHFGVKE